VTGVRTVLIHSVGVLDAVLTVFAAVTVIVTSLVETHVGSEVYLALTV
jgi:hypothetical protein